MGTSLFFPVTKFQSMKRITNFCLILTTFLLVACNSGSTETETPVTTPDSSTTSTTDSSTLKTAATDLLSEKATGTYIFGDLEGTSGGGYLIIEQQADDSLKFELNLNIGAPNYSSGSLTGMLKLEDNVAVFKTTEYSKEEPCAITFTFNKDKTILIKQNEGSSFSCGFGNRVFANGLYTKQKDEAVFEYEGGF
ncbi:MAG: Unknown protein [uncultured Aureispira sp.]|uniref:Lipoprotein n=1 Tax=uncultured Aureispira sp. TaxID=1331704 RepID=A0A6S6SZD5_9BACT|nr:MAG: Unknown protein [uncultured Aureispira sp.]